MVIVVAKVQLELKLDGLHLVSTAVKAAGSGLDLLFQIACVLKNNSPILFLFSTNLYIGQTSFKATFSIKLIEKHTKKENIFSKQGDKEIT